jgi:hypothetical protein
MLDGVTAERRTWALLALAAVMIALLQAVTGATEVVLYAGPLLLVFGFLVSGRYLGEERILARRLRTSAPGRARVVQRWARNRERPLVSLVARRATPLRGPPAALACC